MNIIIPMAGRGSRLRPHTLTVPKPLVPIAGKPIVQRLVEDIVKTCQQKVDNIGFVIGDFGKEVEENLLQIAAVAGAKGHIFYQDQPLGTAHAMLCGKNLMEGQTIVAFADTLFKADFQLDTNYDGIIWTHQVDDPSRFGVVQLDNDNIITEFVEKPATFVSDMAIIGIYFFKDGEYLKNELQYLLDNNIKDKGEYQLTSALENMKQKGSQFTIAPVIEWLDCGNKDATVYTNQRILEFNKEDLAEGRLAIIKDSVIIEPCYISDKAIIKNSIIGPHVSVGDGTIIEKTIVSNSIIQNETKIYGKNFENSMIGNFVQLKGQVSDLSLGDYSNTTT